MANNTDFQNGFVAGYTARAKGVGNLEQVQTDYLQNDETAVDYLKNRPFYKEEISSDTTLLMTTESVFFSEGEVCSYYNKEQVFDDEPFYNQLNEILYSNLGKTLTFNIKNADGTIYTSRSGEVIEVMGEKEMVHVVGNINLTWGDERSNGGEDFLVESSPDGTAFWIFKDHYYPAYDEDGYTYVGRDMDFLNGYYTVEVILNEPFTVTKYNRIDHHFVIAEDNIITGKESIEQLDYEMPHTDYYDSVVIDGIIYLLAGDYKIIKFNPENYSLTEIEAEEIVTDWRTGLTNIGNKLYYLTWDYDNDSPAICEVNTQTKESSVILYSDITNSDILPQWSFSMKAINNELYFFDKRVVKLNLENKTASVVNGNALQPKLSTAVQKDNIVYFFGGKVGGYTVDTIMSYNIDTNEFSTLSFTLPLDGYNFNPAVIDDIIYLFSGYYDHEDYDYNDTRYGTYDIVQKVDLKQSTVEVLDFGINSGSWELYMTPAVVNDKIYLFQDYISVSPENAILKLFVTFSEKTILDYKPVDEISENLTDTNNEVPTSKAIAKYVKNEISNANSNANSYQADYDENNEASKTYIQNRPFYCIPSTTTTEIFYSSTEGDPTATYVADSDSTRLICSPLAIIDGLENNFIEGATIEVSLDLESKGTITKYGTITRTSIVKKHSDGILYAGSWYWYEEDNYYSQDEDFLIVYNVTTKEISIYLSKNITVQGYKIIPASSKKVILTSTYTTPDELKQIDSKYIPDYISKTEVNELINNQSPTEEIPLLSKPKLWELEPGLYRIQDGFYHTNEKELNDIQESFTGITSPTMPNSSIPGYERISGEALLFVYKKTGTNATGYKCDFTMFGETEDKIIHGSIFETFIMLGPDEDSATEYAKYVSFISTNTKTTVINENSTNEQYPSAKAVYDLVQQAVQDALYVNEEDTV